MGKCLFLRSCILWGAVVAAMLSPAAATAQQGGTVVSLAWYSPAQPVHASAMSTLASEILVRTSVEALAMEKSLSSLEQFYSYPLVFWPLASDLPTLKREEAVVLGQWLRSGGTLVLDWTGGAAHIEQAKLALDGLVSAILPGAQVERVPKSSVLYRTFYRVTYAPGRTRLVEDLFAVSYGGRYAIIITYNDMLAAFERNSEGQYRRDVVPGGEQQREDAIRLGVNILLYALCLDYKDDRIHMDYLKSKRNWRLPVDDGQ